jgi:hypothetical protein
LHESRRQRTGFEIHLRAQNWKLDLRYFDAAHLVPRSGRSFGISVGHRVQQMISPRVWMALMIAMRWSFDVLRKPSSNSASRQ